MKMKLWICVLLGAVGLHGWLYAADLTDDQAKVQKVLSDLHHANQMEIQMGQMAKEKGASEDIRSYGQQLMKDHSDADKKVQRLAQKDGIPLTDPGTNGFFAHVKASNEHGLMSDLAKKSGSDFDKAFADAMVTDHKRDIEKLESAQKDLKQTDALELIAEVLPTLQKHLELAQQIQIAKSS